MLSNTKVYTVYKMDVHSNIVELLRKKAREPKKQSFVQDSVKVRELVEDSVSISSISKSIKSPMEAPQEHLIYSQEEIDEDTLPTYPVFFEKTIDPSTIPQSIQASTEDIPEIDKVDVLYVFLVYQNEQYVHLVHHDGNHYTFPVVATESSPSEVESLAKQYNAEPKWSPTLNSAYLLIHNVNTRKLYLKSTVIQQKEIEGVSVHPSVWGFYGMYPEHVPRAMVYSMVKIEDDTNLRGDLIPLFEKYPLYVMEEDAKRFMIEGTPETHTLQEIGYMEYSVSLENKIEEFIKEYNTIQYLCIRLNVQNKVLPLWIQTNQL